MTSTATQAAHFDALFEADADPWGYRTRWYEARKRALTLAALPHARYRHGYEPGCAGGDLSAALADRCDRLVASDGSAAAVATARRRLAPHPHVRVDHATVPRDWPRERFDLVVVSELGYYLDAADLDRLADACAGSLRDGGTLLACHWRHGADDFLHDAAAVHEVLRRRCGLAAVAHHEEADFLLDVWCTDARSVAQREGLA